MTTCNRHLEQCWIQVVQSDHLSGYIRIFPDFRNILFSHFQAAWVTMRRRVTWRLIWNHAV